MHLFLRLLVLGLLLGCFAAGCSTPGIRARQHAAAFHQLSADDQKLVLRGHVRPGLSQEGVYIAWGEPDAKTSNGNDKQGSGTETWVYRQRVTLWEAMSSYDHFGPYHGYGDLPAERSLRPGYGVGGIGNEGSLQYQPNVRSLDTLRIAVFSTGQVDRYKTAGGGWVRPEHNPSSETVSRKGLFLHSATRSSPALGRAKVTRAHAKKNTGLGRSKRSSHHLQKSRQAKAAVSAKAKKHEQARRPVQASGKRKGGKSAGHASGKSLKRSHHSNSGHPTGHAHGKPARTG